jgi:hypothetical protein
MAVSFSQNIWNERVRTETSDRNLTQQVRLALCSGV